MADVHVPAGWPEAVAPPGTQDWEMTAIEFPVKFFWSTDPAVAPLFGPFLCRSRLALFFLRAIVRT